MSQSPNIAQFSDDATAPCMIFRLTGPDFRKIGAVERNLADLGIDIKTVVREELDRESDISTSVPSSVSVRTPAMGFIELSVDKDNQEPEVYEDVSEGHIYDRYSGYSRTRARNARGNLMSIGDMHAPADPKHHRPLGYCAWMDIENPQSGKYYTHTFHVDTGSSLSWVLAEPPMKLVPLGRRANDEVPDGPNSPPESNSATLASSPELSQQSTIAGGSRAPRVAPPSSTHSRHPTTPAANPGSVAHARTAFPPIPSDFQRRTTASAKSSGGRPDESRTHVSPRALASQGQHTNILPTGTHDPGSVAAGSDLHRSHAPQQRGHANLPIPVGGSTSAPSSRVGYGTSAQPLYPPGFVPQHPPMHMPIPTSGAAVPSSSRHAGNTEHREAAIPTTGGRFDRELEQRGADVPVFSSGGYVPSSHPWHEPRRRERIIHWSGSRSASGADSSDLEREYTRVITKGRGRADFQEQPADWEEIEHSVIIGHSIEPTDLRVKAASCDMEYADGSRVVVALPNFKLNTRVTAYKFDESRWEFPIVLGFTFGLAIAVNEIVWRDSTADGLLGLGPMSFQEGFEGCQAPSFLTALSNGHIAKPPANELGGVIMYFGLRVHPSSEQPSIDHESAQPFLAFNRWPCRNEPTFSAPISVVAPDSSTAGPGQRALSQAGRIELWSVILTGMEFLRWENDGHSGEPGWHSTPVVFPNNVNVTLDTGTSVSRLPRFIGEAITRHYRCPGQYDGRILGRAPYVLPRGFNTKEDKVVLHFRGFGREDIAITSQAEHFLYAESPRQRGLYEGLIFEETAAASPILGLNWFHVNWVAMHKPKYNAPYVRVAAQDSDLANDYLLPPILKL